MKRVMASTLLSLLAWGGCGSNDVPNTGGNCKGIVTVNIQNFSKLPTTLKQFQATAIKAGTGDRVSQMGTPPLIAPNVEITFPGQTYATGQYLFTMTAYDQVSGTTSTASVAWVGRTTSTVTEACPSPNLTMAPPTAVDTCLDKCDAQLRCGTLSFTDFLTCQATTCRNNASALMSNQSGWVTGWANFLAQQSPTKYPNGAADATADATAQVQTLVNQLEACNFAACGGTDTCAGPVLNKLMTPS